MKATSSSVAADANVEICPPIPALRWFARTTIAIAFQRMTLLIRRSISRSPGYSGCCWTGIVFTYGVVAPAVDRTPR